MASFVTNRAKAELGKGAAGAINWASDTIKITLVGPTFDGTNDANFVGDVTTLAELSGGSFSAGFGGTMSKTLASCSVYENDTTNKAVLVATTSITWTAAEIGTVYGAVVYKPNSSYANSIMLAFLQLGTQKVTNGGDFTLQLADADVNEAGKGTVIELA